MHEGTAWKRRLGVKIFLPDRPPSAGERCADAFLDNVLIAGKTMPQARYQTS
jgi:hypothetical protein